jgi:hypothetical protein
MQSSTLKWLCVVPVAAAVKNVNRFYIPPLFIHENDCLVWFAGCLLFCGDGEYLNMFIAKSLMSIHSVNCLYSAVGLKTVVLICSITESNYGFQTELTLGMNGMVRSLTFEPIWSFCSRFIHCSRRILSCEINRSFRCYVTGWFRLLIEGKELPILEKLHLKPHDHVIPSLNDSRRD